MSFVKLKKIIFFILLVQIITSLSTLGNVQATMNPIIYSETIFITFDKEISNPIIWYIIDDDPLEYWITVNNSEKGEDIIRSRSKIIQSKIDFAPIGLPTGFYNITLYVLDYSGFTVKSLVQINITRVVYTTPAATSTTSGGTPTFTDSTGAGTSFGLFFAFSALILAIVRVKTKRKDDLT
jgi:hypothetical protein